MKLSEWIYSYRKEHGLSMQGMADLCGLSKQYISVLEKGVNPNTKKEFVPSIETIKKIADATNNDFNSLIALLRPEQDITINSSNPFPKFDKAACEVTEQEQELLADFRQLTSNGKEIVASTAKGLVNNPKYRLEAEKEKIEVAASAS